MPCLYRRLRLVPGAVEVAAVHLGHQGAAKLLSIPKATQAREVCSNIGDNNSQVCVQVTLWIPEYVFSSSESKRFSLPMQSRARETLRALSKQILLCVRSKMSSAQSDDKDQK